MMLIGLSFRSVLVALVLYGLVRVVQSAWRHRQRRAVRRETRARIQRVLFSPRRPMWEEQHNQGLLHEGWIDDGE